jgi:hypothetical protein
VGAVHRHDLADHDPGFDEVHRQLVEYPLVRFLPEPVPEVGE